MGLTPLRLIGVCMYVHPTVSRSCTNMASCLSGTQKKTSCPFPSNASSNSNLKWYSPPALLDKTSIFNLNTPNLSQYFKIHRSFQRFTVQDYTGFVQRPYARTGELVLECSPSGMAIRSALGNYEPRDVLEPCHLRTHLYSVRLDAPLRQGTASTPQRLTTPEQNPSMIRIPNAPCD